MHRSSFVFPQKPFRRVGACRLFEVWSESSTQLNFASCLECCWPVNELKDERRPGNLHHCYPTYKHKRKFRAFCWQHKQFRANSTGVLQVSALWRAIVQSRNSFERFSDRNVVRGLIFLVEVAAEIELSFVRSFDNRQLVCCRSLLCCQPHLMCPSRLK